MRCRDSPRCAPDAQGLHELNAAPPHVACRLDLIHSDEEDGATSADNDISSDVKGLDRVTKFSPSGPVGHSKRAPRFGIIRRQYFPYFEEGEATLH
jgi:hypothetical protein